ncbi:MAG: UDP-N-acetylglucosamine 2-epimerase [Pseudomonadota bacterium]
MKRRKIAIFTGNRAEYGLQYPILRAIYGDERLEPYLIVGGAHLESGFGKTISEIERDGFSVYRTVEMTMRQDSLYATAQAIGTGIVSVSHILDELQPDWLVIYADRFESFAALTAGTQMRIPTAHIEGGDYTEGGALDDSVRHAMTKLAHLHFTTNEHAAKRICQMGEEPWRVFTVGQPCLDLAARGEYANKEEIEGRHGSRPDRPLVLFCQHSVTTEFDLAVAQVVPAARAIKRLIKDGCQVIVTYPNNDAGGVRIIDEINRQFEGMQGKDIQIYQSLGRHNFHGVLHYIGRIGRGAFVGNSSALIKETPYFGCPAVNIGSRQQGRLRGDNVVDVRYDENDIYAAVRKCIDDEAWRSHCAQCANPYGAGNAGSRIAETLATIPIDAGLIQKKMTY